MNQGEHIEEEITIKELINKIKFYYNNIVKGWKILFLFSLIFTGIFVYKHLHFISTYDTQLKFIVENQTSSAGGLGGILGTFGIKNNAGINPSKIIEVGKSKLLSKTILESKFNDDILLSNKIIDIYNLRSKWSEEDERYLKYMYADSTIAEDLHHKTLKKLIHKLWGSPDNNDDAIADLTYNMDKGIYTISSSSIDEQLSIDVPYKIYEAISYFFENKIFESRKQSAAILKAKADSIQVLRNLKIQEIARFEDRNKSLLFRENETRSSILTQEVHALGMAYGELIKNYEMADIGLKDMQPIFVKIDVPLTPITPSNSSILKNILIGMFIGLSIGSLFILLKTFIQEVTQ